MIPVSAASFLLKPEDGWANTLMGVLALLARVPVYRDWTIAGVERLVIPPMRMGQSVVLANAHCQVVGFGTFAFLTEEAEAGYLDGTRPIQPLDWLAGDRIWLIDTVAPFGHGSAVAREIRRALRERGHAGREIRFRRIDAHTGDQRISRARL
jgi:cytolysin-activating lysine-acyltransferase